MTSASSRLISSRFIDAPAMAAASLARAGDVVIDVAPAAGGDQTSALAPIHRAVADEVARALSRGERPRAILGDCCQTIGVVAGLTRAGLMPSVIWLDSHGDFNTWETTPSGFLGGMPLAMLTGRGDQRMLQAVGLNPIDDKRVVLSDARDLDPGERDLVRASGVRHVADVATLMKHLPDGPLYVHFDTDIIDAREAPAFLYPATGGPTADAMRGIIAAIEATGRVVACSATVGWDTRHAAAATTGAVVAHAMAPLFD